MYGKVKVTKRQIKEDKFTTFMLSSREQFQENWQFIAIGIIVVILIAVGATYYFANRTAAVAESSEQYSRALLEYRSGNTQLAILSLSQLLETQSVGVQAQHATFLLGKINFESRNYAEAIRYYQLYLDKFHDNLHERAAVHAGIAASEENQGNYQQAAEEFVAACDEYPDGPQLGDYAYGAMRNFLLVGDAAQAEQHLDVIKDKFRGTDLEIRAERLFSEKSRTPL
ncbi:MAG: tol-pal system YbgF family protein [Candidatus Zixiibacteriota bacterium]